MSNRKNFVDQFDTIDRGSPYVQESFDLDRLDDFVTGLGVEYLHYKGLPSPIGQKDRGDYRRNEGVDTITSNGMIYFLSGKFTATMTDNTKNRILGESAPLDPSQSLLVLPRFYNKNGLADGERIYLSPGDRIYVSDPTVDVLVSNEQKMDFEIDKDNVAMFPVVKLELPIIDSKNTHYVENVDYMITRNGDIRWLSGGKNPGIDPDTGKGRIYSIRYLYRSYWYITSLLKEIRVTNVTTNGERTPARMPYHALVMREYIYHNQNRGEDSNQLKSQDKKREVSAPRQSIDPANPIIVVDMNALEDNEEQS